MGEEARKIKQKQFERMEEIDDRSIYVENVDYGATSKDLRVVNTSSGFLEQSTGDSSTDEVGKRKKRCRVQKEKSSSQENSPKKVYTKGNRSPTSNASIEIGHFITSVGLQSYDYA